MKLPLILLAALLILPASPGATTDQAGATEGKKEVVLPLQLGPKTPEGFNDPSHIHFFRYQAYLLKLGLESLDDKAWAEMRPEEREERINAGETWLKNKLTVLMHSPSLQPTDQFLLAAVWGKDVLMAALKVSGAISLGDPEQIRKAQTTVAGLVKNIEGAEMDWAMIFDNAARGAVAATELPNPLEPKKKSAFLASLKTKEVQAPLASKTTFIQFLAKKQVPPDTFPALTAIYDVFAKASGAEKTETAHILPTIVKFLNDGKKIVDQDLPGEPRALGFAVPGKYDKPELVAVTSLARTSDPVGIGSVLAHEFQHIYDMYTGRYYTLDSELRGFKTNALFFKVMKNDPKLSKKLDELMNSDDDFTRALFKNEEAVARTYDESPQAFADMIAFGHHYNTYDQGVFEGRLTLREAVDPTTGLQRQISGQTGLLARLHAKVEELGKRLDTIRSRPSSIENDKELEKAMKDLSHAQMSEISLREDIAVDTLRLNRMRRELSWMEQRAPGAPFDLSLPVDEKYVIP